MVRFCRIDSFSAASGRKRFDQRSSSSSLSSTAGANRRRAFQARDVLCREETELLLSDEEAANGSTGPPMSTDREGKGESCSLTITDETAKHHSATTTTTDHDDDDDDDTANRRRHRHHDRHHHRHSIPSQLPAQTLEELNVRSLTRLPFPVSAAATAATSGSNSRTLLPLRNCFLSNRTSASAVPGQVPVQPNCSPLKRRTLPEDGVVGATMVEPEQQHRNSDRLDSTGNDAGWRNVDWFSTTRLSPQPNRTSSVSPWNPSTTYNPTAATATPPPPPPPAGHVENSRTT